MQIVLATSNPHKLEEIRAVFDEHDTRIRWRLLNEVNNELHLALTEPVEDQDTFEGNAALKARHYARQSQYICLADDSGIEVDALGGAPGVISARYAGKSGSRDVVDPANNVKLLNELDGVPIDQRTARFVCTMCLVIPAAQANGVPAYGELVRPGDQHVQLIVRGTVEGRIILPEEADDPAHTERGRGSNGFGYDPLFVLPDDHAFAGKTTAELTPDQKNAISHRGEASRLMLAAMRDAKLV